MKRERESEENLETNNKAFKIVRGNFGINQSIILYNGS